MTTATMSHRNDQSIETLRGIAIILMVVGHAIGANAELGLRVDDHSPLRHFYYSTQFLRMPLFTVISGFVYSLRPVAAGSFSRFVAGKARRILLPLVCVSTLQYGMRLATQNVNRPVHVSGIWKIYVFPFDQFWFLQAIFLIFLTVGLLDVAGRIVNFRGWLIGWSAALAASLWMPRFTSVFGFNGYLYLLPYFLLGCGLCRFPDRFQRPGVALAAGVGLAAGLLTQQMAWFEVWTPTSNLDRAGPLALLIGITSGMLLVSYRQSHRGLAWLGGYSYGIFLFHIFGTAGARIALMNLGVESRGELLLASVAVGLAAPILLERYVLSRVPLLHVCLLGVPVPRTSAGRIG